MGVGSKSKVYLNINKAYRTRKFHRRHLSLYKQTKPLQLPSNVPAVMTLD
jgi:hypothetical protein